MLLSIANVLSITIINYLNQIFLQLDDVVETTSYQHLSTVYKNGIVMVIS